MRQSWILEIVVFLLVILALLAAWDKWGAVKPTGTASVIATEAPAVRYAPKASVAIKAPVKVYRGESKANLKLPPLVMADSHKEVLAASQVSGNLRPQTISTVIDTETGDVKTYVKEDPYPWVAFEPRGSIGIAYGKKYSHLGHDSATVGRLMLDYEVVRLKALKLGLTATVDSDSTAFAGVSLSYKF